MYVITKDNPYYSSVEYRETWEEAVKVRNSFLSEMDGYEEDKYKVKVTISQEIETIETTNSY